MASTRKFKAETKQILDLVIHSLYSNKDIFLRELVANAADAIDKCRFQALTDSSLMQEWKIVISTDKDRKTLTISDNGIGMSEEDVVQNLGSIGKSGTRAFLEEMEKNGQKVDVPELIGQFGVGFYSAFMVADRVDVLTRKAGSESAVLWSSSGEGEYSIEAAERDGSGTTITLHLRSEAEQYLESWKISGIVNRYSDFIAYPIVMPEVKVNEDKTETVTERVLNSQKAIWLRKESEVTEEEHKSFLGHLSHIGGGDYTKSIFMSAEGVSEFKALLYIPKNVQFNMFMPELQKKGLQLYVKRVFITDECKELIPDYLRFIRGVVDSSDLPLNVSREILQENPHIKRIEKAVVGKVLTEFRKMLDTEPEAYAGFFREFGKVLKEGIHTDYANAEKIKDLVMYETMSGEEGKLYTLREYVNAMPENQKEIYYLTGERREVLQSSPVLEYYRKAGFDVLFMTDPIDEWVMQSMFQYDKKQFKCISKGDLEIDDKTKTELEKLAAGNAQFLKDVQEALSENVASVRFTGRLSDSPCCLVSDESALSPHMERLFRAMNQEVPVSKRILELNGSHQLIRLLMELPADGGITLNEYAGLLFDQALLAEGSPVKDVAKFNSVMNKVMLLGLQK